VALGCAPDTSRMQHFSSIGLVCGSASLRCAGIVHRPA
jgi:hypothetical protein